MQNLNVGVEALSWSTLSIPIIDWGENRAKVHSAQSTLALNKIQLDYEKN